MGAKAATRCVRYGVAVVTQGRWGPAMHESLCLQFMVMLLQPTAERQHHAMVMHFASAFFRHCGKAWWPAFAHVSVCLLLLWSHCYSSKLL